MKRRSLAIILSLAMLIFLVPVSVLAETAADAEAITPALEENSAALLSEGAPSRGTIEIDGITYIFTLYPDTLTATLEDIKNPENDTEAVIPGTVTWEDEEYTVTDIKLITNYGRYKNIVGLTLPDTLEKTTCLEFGAFSHLTEITIPGSIKKFTGWFQNCELLQKIVFEEGVEEINTEPLAMLGCSSLTEVQLPSTLKRITGLFSNAPALTEIDLPDGLTFIGEDTFSGVKLLKHITLPPGVTEIGQEAFKGCTSLERVEAGGPITSIGPSAFANCPALVSFAAPDSAITSIGANAFNGCSALVEIPDLGQVTEMGDSAFESCTVLECDVDLSSLDAIPYHAFAYAPLTNITLSDHLTSIGDWAFLWSHITSVELPDTLESIGSYGFWYSWLGFPNGTVVLPDSLTSLGASAFQNIYAETIYVGSGLTEVSASAFADNAALKKVIFNNSEDDVTIPDGAIPDGVEIEYLIASIGDVGDSVSDGDDALTLQEAVNRSQPGDTITLSKNVKLDQALVIPAGKDVTITAEEEYTLIGNKKSGLTNLIIVEEGAAVTLDGTLILSGRYNDGGIIDNEGKTTLTGDASVRDGRIGLDTGVIDTHGSKAEFIMTGGIIEENRISDQRSGAVRISDGASIRMSGGVIQNNQVTNKNGFNSSSGILLWENSSGEMTGGVITGNSAIRGSAIMLYSEGNPGAGFTLSGGVISDNICESADSDIQAAGAVYIGANSAFTMTGGRIAENRGDRGAGVCVVDSGLQSEDEEEYGTSFVMEGGTIADNEGSVGGGIYSYSNGVYLNAGQITGNTAFMGGGVYSEGNHKHYSTLHMKNVVITENASDNQGGGMWYCATGDARVYILSGGAIYANTAEGAGDDFISGLKTGSAGRMESSVTLADRMLGGGRVLWCEDGAISMTSTGGNGAYPTTSSSSAEKRYGMEGVDPTPRIVQEEQKNLALKAVVDPTAAEYARSKAELFITGNTASRFGGGVAANGGIVIGEEPEEDDLKDISVTKIWKDNDDAKNLRPEFVTVELLLVSGDERIVLETLILNEENQWTGTFKDLPAKIEGRYEVFEEEVPGYTTAVDGTVDTQVTITNTLPDDPSPGSNQHTTSLTVKKVWKLDDGGTAADSIRVQLLCDGTVRDTVELSDRNDWTKTWTKLKEDHTWTVQEIDVPEGFVSKVTNKGMTFTITNDDVGDTPDDVVPPGDSDTPDDVAPPGGFNTPDSPEGTGKTALPQTGQPWGITWLLAAAAILLGIWEAIKDNLINPIDNVSACRYSAYHAERYLQRKDKAGKVQRGNGI